MTSVSTQKGVTSIIYGGIIVAIIIVFMIQFRPQSGSRTGSLAQQCAVTVRDRCIDPKDFWAAFSLISPHGLDEARQQKMQIRRIVLEGLLERTLLVQDAERLKISVSEEDVNDQLRKGRVHVSLPVQSGELMAMNLQMTDDFVRLMPFQNPETKQFDYKIYKRVIRTQTNRSEPEFKEMQRQELIAARMRDLVRSRARIGDAEAFDIFQRDRATASIDSVSFHRAWFAARYLDTSAGALEAWANVHAAVVVWSWAARKAEFPPGCRRARHILVKLRSDKQPEGHEREDAERLIEKAVDRIRTGEDFGVVAADLSEDEGSGPRGGELGCFAKGKMVKPFEDAVFGLKGPGDIAQKVESPYGLHIIQLEGAVSEDPAKAEADGKAMVARDFMIGMQTDQIMSDAAKKARELTVSGSPLDKAVSDALVELDQKYAKEMKKAAGARAAADAKLAGKDKDKPTTEGDSLRPKVETSAAFTIDSRPLQDAAPDQNVAALAFKLDKPGAVAPTLVRLTDGYAVIQLKDKKPATREEFDKDRDAFIGRLQQRKGSELLNEYVARLRMQAKGEAHINEGYLKAPDKDKQQQGGEEEPEE